MSDNRRASVEQTVNVGPRVTVYMDEFFIQRMRAEASAEEWRMLGRSIRRVAISLCSILKDIFSFLALHQDIVEQESNGTGNVPQTYDEVVRTVSQDPEWGTYNTKNWKILTDSENYVHEMALDPEALRPSPIIIEWSDEPKRKLTDASFELMTKLPTELRLLVWSLLLPEPRFLEVHAAQVSEYLEKHRRPKERAFISESFMACTDSWNAFQTHYGRLRLVNKRGDIYFGWIDYTRDTLAFTVQTIRELLGLGYRLDLSRLKHLALAGVASGARHDELWELVRCLQCPNLKVFTIILSEDLPGEGPQSDFNFRLTPFDEDFVELERMWDGRTQGSKTRLSRYVSRAAILRSEFAEARLVGARPGLSVTLGIAIVTWTFRYRGLEQVTVVPTRKLPFQAAFAMLMPVKLPDGFFPGGFDGAWHIKIPARGGAGFGSPYDGISELFEEHTELAEKNEANRRSRIMAVACDIAMGQIYRGVGFVLAPLLSSRHVRYLFFEVLKLEATTQP